MFEYLLSRFNQAESEFSVCLQIRAKTGMRKEDKRRNRMAALLMTGILTVSGCSSALSSPASSDQETQNRQQETETVQACDAASDPQECAAEDQKETGENIVSGFEKLTFEEAINFFRDKKTGILYFGFPDCPWCQQLLPVLEEAREETGQTIYYIQTRDENRERLYTEDQKEEIEPWIRNYMKNNEDGVLTLYVPLVLNVQDGTVIAGHQGTEDGHDAHERQMTEEEKNLLKEQLLEVLDAQD